MSWHVCTHEDTSGTYQDISGTCEDTSGTCEGTQPVSHAADVAQRQILKRERTVT